MRLRFILIFCIVFCFFGKSQKPSKHERIWAFKHPIAAIKAKHISKKCFIIYEQIKNNKRLDTNSNGGKLDAFRHVFFMAAFAQNIKIKKIDKLGLAHEKANYDQFLKNGFENGEVPDSISSVMDLKNNTLGFEIGIKEKKLNLMELSNLVITNINNGLAVIIKRNKKGKYVDCEGNIILPTATKKWNINKCLVKSNEDYNNVN